MHMLRASTHLMLLLFACCRLSDAVYQFYEGLSTDIWRESGFDQDN